MKVLKFILVVLCAVVLFRLAACTTGLAPTPDATPIIPTNPTNPQNPQIQPERPEGDSDSISGPDPAQARDAALEDLLAEIPEAGSEASMPGVIDWQSEDVTPQNLLGAVSTLYRGGGWEILVRYPVVAPANTRYTVEIRNQSTDSSWEVVLDANYQILSLNPLSP